MEKSVIIEMVDEFISGKNISIDRANKIGVAVSKAYPEDEYMQDIEVFLACYRPEGGDFLYNEVQAKEKLHELREKLVLK